jgi:hypothetical protein
MGFAEVALRERVKQAGGKWNPRRKVGERCEGHVVALSLAARIVEEEATTSRDQAEFPKSLYRGTSGNTPYSGRSLYGVPYR